MQKKERKPKRSSRTAEAKPGKVVALKREGNQKLDWLKGLGSRSGQFLREVRVELKKTTWPGRKDTLSSTMVVLVVVLIISLFLGLVDLGLSNLIGHVIR